MPRLLPVALSPGGLVVRLPCCDSAAVAETRALLSSGRVWVLMRAGSGTGATALAASQPAGEMWVAEHTRDEVLEHLLGDTSAAQQLARPPRDAVLAGYLTWV